MSIVEHTFMSWAEQFFPVRNHADFGFESFFFETYGDDLRFVESCDRHNVWTLVETEQGRQIIVEGCRFVNRLGYFVTVVPWSEPTEVTL